MVGHLIENYGMIITFRFIESVTQSDIYKNAVVMLKMPVFFLNFKQMNVKACLAKIIDFHYVI